MRAIKRRDTKPELLVKEALSEHGLPYLGEDDNDYPGNLVGKPDIIFSEDKVAVFIDGCFWHKHDCKYFKWPKTRKEFWKEKIEGNVTRDKLKREQLLKDGWRIFVIWECCLKGKDKLNSNQIAALITEFMRSKQSFSEMPPKTQEAP